MPAHLKQRHFWSFSRDKHIKTQTSVEFQNQEVSPTIKLKMEMNVSDKFTQKHVKVAVVEKLSLQKHEYSREIRSLLSKFQLLKIGYKTRATKKSLDLSCSLKVGVVLLESTRTQCTSSVPISKKILSVWRFSDGEKRSNHQNHPNWWSTEKNTSLFSFSIFNQRELHNSIYWKPSKTNEQTFCFVGKGMFSEKMLRLEKNQKHQMIKLSSGMSFAVRGTVWKKSRFNFKAKHTKSSCENSLKKIWRRMIFWKFFR